MTVNISFADCEKANKFTLVNAINNTVIQVYALPVMLKKLKLNGSMKTYKTF